MIKNKKEICHVITKEKSDFNSDFCDLSTICKENNIDYTYVKNINDSESKNIIKNSNPDVIYCIGWSQLINKEILSIPKRGIVGFHPAKLPQNRGRHPIIWALVLGLKDTASTFFFMKEDADNGNIISQEEIIINKNDYAIDLYNKIMCTAKKQIIDITNDLEKGTCKEIIQDNSKSNSWRKRSKVDGQIDWRMSCEGIYNLIRALSKPYVGASFIYKNKEYKVWRCKIENTDKYENIEYGKVVNVINENEIIVKAFDGLVHLLECDPIKVNEGEYLI